MFFWVPNHYLSHNVASFEVVSIWAQIGHKPEKDRFHLHVGCLKPSGSIPCWFSH